MESGALLQEKKAGEHQVVVEIQDAVRSSESQVDMKIETSSPAQLSPNSQLQPIISAKPPTAPELRQRPLSRSAYSKPKSRVLEPQSWTTSKAAEQSPLPAAAKSPYRNSNTTSPTTQKITPPITPKTPLMASVGGNAENEEEDDDDGVYKAERIATETLRPKKKVQVMHVIEWVVFVVLMTLLIASLLVSKLIHFRIWSLSLWRWCVLVLVVFCGGLFTEWAIIFLVFMIERLFLLKKKVLYFFFGLKRSLRVVIWFALILMAWCLLINRDVRRSERTSTILDHITRGIVCAFVGAILWMVKTFLVKLVATRFHVRTYFDRIQESIFHQYILQALSGILTENAESGNLNVVKMAKGTKGAKEQVINVDKLYKMKREKVSAWTMGGLIQVIRNSGLPTISLMLDDMEEESGDAPKEIKNEVEAIKAANRIFKKLAKPGNNYIEEDELLNYMPKEEVDNAIPLFEGAAETRRIKRSSFRNWVLKAYKERKLLALSLNDAKTAIEELNKISSALVIVVIILLSVLVLEVVATKVLVFIFSQILLAVFMFGNMAKTVFEAIIFVFVVHPFDVGDRCVIDGVQMIVDEMNIMTTIFLKSDNEKVYYPNAQLSTKPISNFNRSPEMGDSVEFAIDFSTPVATLDALKAQIKRYVESRPQHWSPNHSVLIKEVVDLNKMVLALYLTHTINFQSPGRGDRKSDLILELKKILEDLGIKYHLPPQEVHVRYLDASRN